MSNTQKQICRWHFIDDANEGDPTRETNIAAEKISEENLRRCNLDDHDGDGDEDDGENDN